MGGLTGRADAVIYRQARALIAKARRNRFAPHPRVQPLAAPSPQRVAQSHCPDAAPLLVGAIDRRDHGRGFGPQIVDQFVESALRLKCLVELDLEEDDRRGGAGQGAFEGVLGKTVDIILAIR
jgi:hypothetical protein